MNFALLSFYSSLLLFPANIVKCKKNFSVVQVGVRPAGHQLPMLEQSPSLRKNRYFFQSTEIVHENGNLTMTQIELGEDPNAGKALLVRVSFSELINIITDNVIECFICDYYLFFTVTNVKLKPLIIVLQFLKASFPLFYVSIIDFYWL